MQTIWTVNAKRRGFTVLAVSVHVELSRAPVASSYLSASTAKYKSHVSVNSGEVDCRDWFLMWSRAAVVFARAPISPCCLWPKQRLLVFLFFKATCMRRSQHAFVIKVHSMISFFEVSNLNNSHAALLTRIPSFEMPTFETNQCVSQITVLGTNKSTLFSVPSFHE